jgi:general stress protein 26
MMTNYPAIPQLIKLINDKSIGVLTCLDYGGALVSKPIRPLEHDNKYAIWFFIDLYAGSISHLCIVNLSFSESQAETYISLSGRGKINNNQAHIESLWSDSSRRWFNDGPISINLTLLKFSLYAADCWDVSQRKLRSLFTMFLSLITSALMQIVSSIDNKNEPLTNLKHRKILREIKL